LTSTIRIKRRSSGSPGAPSSLAAAELAYNEVDNKLYYGAGNSGGQATSIVAIAGPGAIPAASSTTPAMNGTAAVGTGTTWARADHVHQSDTSRVAKAGDTMTGNLIIGAATGYASVNVVPAQAGNSALFGLQKSGSGVINAINAANGSSLRWGVQLGNAVAESGSNVGSDFSIDAYSDSGASIGSPITITRATGKVEIQGTNTNDNAAAGRIGEYVAANVAWASAVPISANVWANVTSLTLTAGDWDIDGSVTFNGAASTTVYTLEASISTTSGAPNATPPSMISAAAFTGGAPFANGVLTVHVGRARLSLATTTTVYLVGAANFATSTMTIYGAYLGARRMR
jgi:hypothetical protein